MADTAADVLIDTIQHRGVEVVLGLPGEGKNGLNLAIRWKGGTRIDASINPAPIFPRRVKVSRENAFMRVR